MEKVSDLEVGAARQQEEGEEKLVGGDDDCCVGSVGSVGCVGSEVKCCADVLIAAGNLLGRWATGNAKA